MLLRTRSNYFGFRHFLLYRLLFLFLGGGGPGEKDLIGEGGGGAIGIMRVSYVVIDNFLELHHRDVRFSEFFSNN